MATIVPAVSATTTGTNVSLTTGAFTPEANDLLIVVVRLAGAAGNTSFGTISDSQGLDWWWHAGDVGSAILTVARSVEMDGGPVGDDIANLYIARALAANVSTTVTFNLTGGMTDKGVAISVLRVSGISRVGEAAIRSITGSQQIGTVDNHAGGATPTVAFFSGHAALTGNPTIGVLVDFTNPAHNLTPSGWTTCHRIGYNAVADSGPRGLLTFSRDSGFTGNAITYSGTEGDDFGAIIIELDTSGDTSVSLSPLSMEMQLQTTVLTAGGELGGESGINPLQLILAKVDNPIDTPVAMFPMEMVMQLSAPVAESDVAFSLVPLQTIVRLNPQIAMVEGGGEASLSPLTSEIQLLSSPVAAIVETTSIAIESTLNPPTAAAGAVLQLSPLALQMRFVSPTLSTSIGIELQEICLADFPLETITDANVTLELQEIVLDAYPVEDYNASGNSTAKFAEITRSSSSIIIFGSTPHKKFKVNPSAYVFHRGGPSHVIHLGPASPSFGTIEAAFNLLTPSGDLQPNEFTYEAPGGFLKIYNQNLIQSSLIADGDTAEIPITRIITSQNFSVPAITTLTAKRKF